MAVASPTPIGMTSSPFSPPPPMKQTDTGLRPNPHPYAIKTTSTAILARSNSSGHAVAARHHYVPSSPKRSELDRSHSANAAKSKSEYRGHRYSTSLSADKSSFPPGPPSPARSTRSLSEDNPSPEPFPLSRRTRVRADTLPDIATASAPDLTLLSSSSSSNVSVPTIGTTEDLPSNPKLWTPAQLSSYLVTALRVRSTDVPQTVMVAAPVARDIAAWVRTQGITGRTFLRWNEDDLETLGINTLWRTALLNASRNLRQNVLRGRIWGADTEADTTAAQQPPFASALYSSTSSSSSLDLSEDEQIGGGGGGARLRRRNAGRVRGLVNHWERSSSDVDGSSDSERSEPSSPIKIADTLIQEEQDTEPTIEELLLKDTSGQEEGSWGAKAWEAMDVGSTVRRVDEEIGRGDTVRSSGSGDGFVGSVKRVKNSNSARRVHGNSTGRRADERRIVTALFVGEPDSIDDDDGAKVMKNQSRREEKKVMEEAQVRALEMEMADTRALIDALRVRVEEVERRVSEMEAREAAVAATMTSSMEDKAMTTEYKATTTEEEATATADKATATESTAATSKEDTTASSKEDKAAVVRRTAVTRALLEPYGLRDLPGYLALVGFGVCAVVLKVILRRIVTSRKP